MYDMKTLEICGRKYPVVIERKAIKNMYMRITQDQQISITCNYRLSDEQIDSFILSKIKWLESAIKKSEEKANSISDGNKVKILGQEFDLYISQGSKDSCIIKGNQVIITVRNLTQQHVCAVFYKTMASMLSRIIEQKKERWNRLLDDYRLSYPHFQIKKMKSRWGSCTPSKGLIVMNVMLMHYPIECIDAVLLHEYVHLIVPNHSKRFYQIIENNMPDYKRIHGMLK